MPRKQKLTLVGSETADTTIPSGQEQQVASGGKLAVQSGGVLDIESGGYLKIAGTAVTPSAAQLNRAAVTTPGTAEASKIAVLGANKNLDTLVLPVGGLYIGSGAGTSVTPTAAELNILAGVTPGTVLASKGVVVGSSKEVNEWTVTEGVLVQTKTVATAALGTVRGVYGKVTTSHAAIASGLATGARGEVTISGVISAGGASFYGAQGKLIITGTMNHADSRLTAVMAQLDTTGATLTSGQISGLWVDHGAGITGAGGGQFNMIRITNTVAGSKPNAIIYAHSNATNLLDLSAPAGTMDWIAAAGASAGSAGKSDGCAAQKVLIISVGGVPYYIPAFDQNT